MITINKDLCAMNTNKIKKALQACQGLLAENYAEYDGPPEKHPLNFIDDALAELDKAQQPGKVLTDDKVDKAVRTFVDGGLASPIDGVLSRFAVFIRDNGYLAPAAGLTVRSITLTGEQPDPTGEIKVLVEFSDGTELEVIRTCANSIFHMVTWGGLMEEHSILTAAERLQSAKR